MDYPHIENFLAPIYGTGAGSNDTGYSNKEFDAKLVEAAAAATAGGGERLYQEAEAILVRGLPDHAGMWIYLDQSGYSNRVTDVKLDPFGKLDIVSIKVK